MQAKTLHVGDEGPDNIFQIIYPAILLVAMDIFLLGVRVGLWPSQDTFTCTL